MIQCSMQNAECRMKNAECRMQNAECRMTSQTDIALRAFIILHSSFCIYHPELSTFNLNAIPTHCP